MRDERERFCRRHHTCLFLILPCDLDERHRFGCWIDGVQRWATTPLLGVSFSLVTLALRASIRKDMRC